MSGLEPNPDRAKLPAAPSADGSLSETVCPVRPSARYRFLRGLVRIGLRFYFRKRRLLSAVSEAESGPVLLVASRPASFFDALILVAVFEREIHCVVSQDALNGWMVRLGARGLGMVAVEAPADSADYRQAVMDAACARLAEGEAVALLSDPGAAGPEPLPGTLSNAAAAAASLVLETESLSKTRLNVRIFPVHLFVPIMPVWDSGMKEALADLGEPVVPAQDFAPAAPRPPETPATPESPESFGSLASTLETRLRSSPFRLRPEQLEETLSDLERILRDGLEEFWAARPDWKQKTDGFRLSGYAQEWAEQMNDRQPEGLIALRVQLAAYREARRIAALRRLEAEGVGMDSASRRLLARLRGVYVPWLDRRARRMRTEITERLNQSIHAYAQRRAQQRVTAPALASKSAAGGSAGFVL